MSFCDISFNRTGGSVTDVLNKEGRESALYPQLVSYVQQDPQTVYDSKKEYFDTLVDQGKLVEGKVKEGVDFVFNENPELAKIGNKEQYSQYLDSVFPDSKVKDVLKHTTKAAVEKFKKGTGRLGEGVYLASSDYKMYDKAGPNTYSVVVNIFKLKRYDVGKFNIEANNKFPTEDEYSKKPQKKLQEQDKVQGVDAYVSSAATGTEYNVFEPEQIHILGSKQDIEGFKSFVQQQKSTPIPTDELALGLYSIAYNSGVSEQEFMDRINRDGNLSVFGVGGQVSGQQVFNQTVPVQQVSVEQERKLKNVAYEHFGLQGYLDYITDEDKYNVPWVKSFVGEAMIVFAGSDATREQLDKEKQKITDRVKEKERKVEQIYRQYLEQGGDVNSLKQFRHYVESEQYVLVDESGMTQTGLDTNLSQKIQNLMQEKYPEIKLDITNEPVFQKETEAINERIIGQANIKAMTVLIDAVNQKQDTLPHEYAHHYIAWFRNTPMVRQAISQWGSEEALVQAIGEQVVAQKGEALNWWKRFVRLILSMFGKVSNNDRENIKNMLTTAFLEGRDLQTGQVGISRERSKELAEKAMEKPPLPQSTEEFISETMKSYNKQNALYAKRLESLLKEYPVKLEQAGASGMIAYNPQTKTIVVPLSVDDVFQNQVQKEILNQLMVGIFDQAVKQKIPRYTKNEVIARGYPYTFTRMQVESLKERYGKGIELKNYFGDVIDFVAGYMTDPELSEWAENRLFPQKMAIEKMAEFISTSVFGKPILKNSVEEYLKTIWLRKSYDKPITNNNIDEIVSEIEEYGVIEGNYKESKVKVKERIDEAANLINEIYRAYGEKVSDFVFMSEGPDGTLTITVNRGKITEYQEEIKNQTRENIAANNKYQIEEIERKKETDMVDAVGYLDYLSDEDKRLAQIFIERGDFPLQCGI